MNRVEYGIPITQRSTKTKPTNRMGCSLLVLKKGHWYSELLFKT